MSKKITDKARLEHILEAIHKIEKYTDDVDYSLFTSSDITIDACFRNLEIIGEATNNLSDDIFEMDTTVSWRSIVGLRNLIVHEYFAVDVDFIWKVINNELPKLKVSITRILSKI